MGSTNFKEFLETEVKDFIFFKADLLITSVGNDPIKKTEVLKNLLQSISLIPDALKRSMYIKECSKLVESDEKILIAEVNKIRKIKSPISQEFNPEVQDLLNITVSNVPHYVGGDEQEKGLIRLLVQSGHKKFMEDATVADFIFKELSEDEQLSINNPLFQKIINEVKVSIENNLTLDESFFINHIDSEVRQMAADFHSEKYELSSYWGENGLFLKTEKENYVRDLQSLFLFLKKFKLEQLIKNNMNDLSQAPDYQEAEVLTQYHIQLIEVRNKISEILGTIYN
jgi:DNA primase